VAVAELATSCAADGVALLLVSTNEVFDGMRSDGHAYVETDEVHPINAYGQSKLAGEELAREAFAAHGVPDLLWIVRTAWLFGPPGNDFPTKIVAAADRIAPGAALRVVDDEVGSPTYTPDLAAALIELLTRAPAGTYHVTASGHASRFEVAREVLARCRSGTPIEPISQRDFRRASSPPPWGVLDCSLAAAHGVALRDWHEALADYLPAGC
jgi:dTDP-4-dehydrorhamnose reductase